MINFFRKIRAHQLAEGKISKYLKYAVGEIFLVVIGILIALQINNWNEQNILAHQSEEVLENLRNEIIQSKAELALSLAFLEQRVNNNLHYLNNSNKTLADSIKIKEINRMVFFYTEKLSLPLIENELGPNKKIFHWPEFTKALQELSESVQYYNKGIEYIENDVQTNQLPYLVEQGLIVDIMVSNRVLDFQEYKNAHIYQNERFRNIIAVSTLMIKSLVDAGKNVVDEHEKMLQTINN